MDRRRFMETTAEAVVFPDLASTVALARHHARLTTVPISRLLIFTDGCDPVRVQCYLHTSDYAKQGWFDKAERIVKLGKPFQFQ